LYIARDSNSLRDESALVQRIGRATGAGCVALGERVASLWGGYGELWRAKLTSGSQVTPVIVKDVRPPPREPTRSHRRKLRSYAVEHEFYRRYAERCLTAPSCRVARPLGLLADPDGWLFALEDLDHSGFAERETQPEPMQILATLRWLAGFHARFLGVTPDQLWQTGGYWHLATRPDELAAMRHDSLRAAAAQLDRELEAARFKTLVHGDAKLENVCFAVAKSEVALVDFQYVGGGVGVKDVAYFLSGCLLPREYDALVPTYLNAYFRELGLAVQAAGVDVDARELEREWRALFPLVWVDFYRFLLGWAPGHFDGDPYSEKLTFQVLASLKSG
jgi:hypothetical protein